MIHKSNSCINKRYLLKKTCRILCKYFIRHRAQWPIQASVHRPPSCPRATSWQGTIETTKSDGGQFPSHPGRPGPETSSEGTHLTPNPQEIQAGFTPPTQPPTFNPSNLSPRNTAPSVHPSIPALLLLGGRKAP